MSDRYYSVSLRHDLPSFASRVQRCLEPAKVAFLVLVIQIDNLNLVLAASLVYIESRMYAMVSAGYRHTLRFQVDKCLECSVNT